MTINGKLKPTQMLKKEGNDVNGLYFFPKIVVQVKRKQKNDGSMK